MAKQTKAANAAAVGSGVSGSAAAEGAPPADQAGGAANGDAGADTNDTTITGADAGATTVDTNADGTSIATARALSAADVLATIAALPASGESDAGDTTGTGGTGTTPEPGASQALDLVANVDLGPLAGLEFPVTGTLRNHGGHPFTEAVTGKLVQAGGSEEVTLHDEAHASRFLSNLADIRKHMMLDDWMVALEVHKRAPQESE